MCLLPSSEKSGGGGNPVFQVNLKYKLPALLSEIIPERN
jgi:hypothetical protein